MKSSFWFRQSLYSSVFQYLALVLNFIFYTFAISVFGAEVYGHFSYLIAVHQVLFVCASLGMPVALLKFSGPQESLENILSPVVTILVVFLGLSSWVYVLVYKLFFMDLIWLLSIASMTSLMAFLQPYWQWKNEFPKYNFYQSILAALKVLAMLTISVHSGLKEWILPFLVVGMFLFIVVVSRRLWRWRGFLIWTLKWRDYKGLFDKSLWVSQLSLFVYTKVDVLMLPLLGVGMLAVGQYAYVYSFFSALLLVPSVVQNVLLRPMLNQKLQGNLFFKKVYVAYGVLGFLFTFTFLLLMPMVIHWVLPQLGNVFYVTTLLAPSLMVVFVANLFGMALLVEKKESLRASVHWKTAFLNIVLNTFFIPIWGIEGAALATTISYFFLLLGFWKIVTQYRIWNIDRQNFRVSMLMISCFIVLCSCTVFWQMKIQ